MSTPRVRSAVADALAPRFADDVRYYLSLEPRQLPSRYLYDALGSALFDAICQLPWYRITRAERDLLRAHGREILGLSAEIGSIVELGGGSGEKLAMLLETGRPLIPRPTIHLIDVSASALALSSRVVGGVDDLQVVTHEATYENGLLEVGSQRPSQRGRVLTLLLGSNIGNFDRPAADAFLRQVRASIQPGDALLIGVDLVKPEPDLLLAYDDPLGVTAAFNRNLLVRINRELGGTFDLDGFAHRAVWNPEASRVEMHLVSRRAQRASVAGADLRFDEGETIWTESSYKYTADGVLDLLEGCGFRRRRQWIEPRAAFSLTLAEAV